MTKGLNIIFAGTPEFAATHLSAITNSEHKVIAVYTQPDRPAGRGRKLTPSPVKQLALDYNLLVLQPATLKGEEEQKQFAEFGADIMIVVAYGLILPLPILNAPRLGCVNVHASILPRWRGAAPIQRAILAGDSESGVTIMQMDKGLDTGDMLLIEKTSIASNDTAESLHDRLAEIGAKCLLEVLERSTNKALDPQQQDDSLANYAAKIQKSEAQIDWQQSAASIHRKICAFNPWPVAQTLLEDKTLRIWESILVDGVASAKPGTVINESKFGVDVATGNGLLRITRLQSPGGKPLNASEYLNAHTLAGKIFDV